VFVCSIHPRLKHDVADRLVLSALAVAYHKSGIDYQGPYPTSYTLHRVAANSSTVVIEYNHGTVPIDVRSNGGFQVRHSAYWSPKHFLARHKSNKNKLGHFKLHYTIYRQLTKQFSRFQFSPYISCIFLKITWSP
jgi:hypothetical protein